jgi:uncharacterized membrane protein YobD (UPF0266 family)
MLEYNDLYKKAKEDQVADNGALDSEYMLHCIEKTKIKAKQRHDNGSQLQSLTVGEAAMLILAIYWVPWTKIIVGQQGVLLASTLEYSDIRCHNFREYAPGIKSRPILEYHAL